MEKKVVEKVINEVIEKNEMEIGRLKGVIESGGNKKSIESVICGIRKNNNILNIIRNVMNGEEIKDVNIIRRMEYKGKVELKEVSKREIIEKGIDLDDVIIKKINGVNKFFIKE